MVDWLARLAGLVGWLGATGWHGWQADSTGCISWLADLVGWPGWKMFPVRELPAQRPGTWRGWADLPCCSRGRVRTLSEAYLGKQADQQK